MHFLSAATVSADAMRRRRGAKAAKFSVQEALPAAVSVRTTSLSAVRISISSGSEPPACLA